MADVQKEYSPWPRFIALVDMNAFFASIEQQDRPELFRKPVGVTNGSKGTTIITCSYEARAYGIHTGMKVKEARQRCPDFIQVPARSERYAEISTRIMAALEKVTPDIEVFSCDEAFLDITHCQNYWKQSPEAIGAMIKRIVLEVSGLLCSVGISGDKTTAKYAAKVVKPDGLVIIPPWEARQRLENVPVRKICGIGPGIEKFLKQYEAHTCGDVAKLPVTVLGDRFGNPCRRLWLMCRGEDPAPVATVVRPPKSLGHGKVMPPNTKDREIIRVYLMHMGEKVGQRLRRYSMVAQHYFIGVRSYDGWIGSNKFRTRVPTNDSRAIHELSDTLLEHYWQGEGVHQVQITATDPRPCDVQSDFFDEENSRTAWLNRAIDQINDRYGEFALAPALLLDRSDTPNVIAPSWQPHGHRQTIVSASERNKSVK